jgi:alpha-amylase
MRNKTLIQYFEWYLPVDCRHWQRTAQDAAHLAYLGITDAWLPPAYKGQAGLMDVGYGVYDLYDLGEFYQKGTIPTKYGAKDEYLAAIQALHNQGVRVLGDVVLNHRMGADYPESTTGSKMAGDDRLETIVESKKLSVWTGFEFPGRNGKYSSFRWNKSHFSGVDWNSITGMSAIFKLSEHTWSTKVDGENGNYDYLMGADVDFKNPEVRAELTKWGKWYLDTAKIDGVRLDAVKHISYDFFPQWLNALREHTGREVFAVGEYWLDDLGALMAYLDHCQRCMSLFDVPLHHRFERASQAGKNYDLRTIFDNTLVSCDPVHAVTLVDNHDTQPGQALESWVQPWFKPLAYALILLREAGIPCVFYGDLYGIPHDDIPPVRELEKLLIARRKYAAGTQTDYFDHPNVIGWTREGGMAAVLSNGDEGWKYMKLGKPGDVFVDFLGNRGDRVIIGPDGFGKFMVNPGSVSVWVPEK